MTNFEDDLDGGGRTPSMMQVIHVSAHLQSKKLDWGPRPTHRELMARNFDISVATVQRILKKAGIEPPPVPISKANPVQEADDRVSAKRHRNAKIRSTEATNFTKKDTILDLDDVSVRSMADLLEEKNTSASLAIMENRARMALNIVIAEMMAAKPHLLLLDMRGTAALVDALTVAAKLSGGNSMDIRYPTDEERRNAAAGLSPDGSNTMKDITPVEKSAFATSLENFRKQRRVNGNGAGT